MSDIFDHMFDAYYSRDNDCGFGVSLSSNPLFYHSLITYHHLEHETDKAYLVQLNEKYKELQVWLPKKIIRKLNKGECTCYVHTDIFLKILKTAYKEQVTEKLI